MANKVDIRIVRSRDSLVNALVELLKEKSFEEISISEICLKANVNRNTFYSHFPNITGLFSEFKGKYLERFISILEEENNTGDSSSIFLKVLEQMKEFGDRTVILFNSSSCCDILRTILRLSFSNEFQSIKDTSVIDDKDYKNFLLGGISSIIFDWVNDNFQEETEIVFNKILYLVKLFNSATL